MAIRRRLVPYGMISPGFEAVFTGERSSTPLKQDDWPISRFTNDEGNVIERWSVWTWTPVGAEESWSDEIRQINRMQAALGPLDDETRWIRAHIGSLVLCDPGIPVTIDELLIAIGRGRLEDRPFRNGCWCCSMWGGSRSTQPRHLETMRIVHDVLSGYLAGKPEECFVRKYPHGEGFIRRTFDWLGRAAELTQIQKLLMERMLLPFDFFTKASHADRHSVWSEGAEEACEATMKNCYEAGGRGSEIDTEIAALAGLPEISMKYPEHAREAAIDDPERIELYILCCALAHGLHTLADCHHSTFRWIENWIYAIGTGKWGIPTRTIGTERKRLGRLLFGYCLGLDKWLLGKGMQFPLLDLGHVDLGFDPKNEILRVYAYLGNDRTPLKEWLAACLWYNLMGGGNPRSVVIQERLLERAKSAGVSLREWTDSELLKNQKRS